MQTGTVDAFEAAAQEANTGTTRTTAAEFESTLAEILVKPVVGTELPFEGVSLPSSVEIDPTPSELADAATGVTAAGLAIAEYGSVVIESTPTGEESASLFPERHVAVVAGSDVVSDVSGALERLTQIAADGRDAVIQTGPSATADMGDLVYGAHGPRAVHVVVIEDR